MLAVVLDAEGQPHPADLAVPEPSLEVLALTETRIHLELLAAQGRLVTSTDGDVTVYAPAGLVTGS